MGKFGIEAGPDGKEPPDQFQRFSQGSGGRVWTKIDGTIFLSAPDNA
jgi:hypothetical protein